MPSNFEDNGFFDENGEDALPKLQRLQKRLAIPDRVAKDALRIYNETVKRKLTMGWGINTLLSASIFRALRVHGIPRTVEEISKVAQVSKKKVKFSYRIMLIEILPNLNFFKLKAKVREKEGVNKVDKEDFIVYEIQNNVVKLEIEPEELQNYLNPIKVLIIIRKDLNRIYIWRGSKSPVRKRFISARVAQDLQRELIEDARYQRCKIVSIKQGNEKQEFLNVFRLKSKEKSERDDDGDRGDNYHNKHDDEGSEMSAGLVDI